MTFKVYKITHNSMPVYVGYTSRDLKTRLNEHKSKKNLSNDFIISEICQTETIDDARKKESELIKELGTLGKLNVFADHCGKVSVGKRRVWTQEQKDVFGKKWEGRTDIKGKKRTEEQKLRISLATKGVKKRPGTADSNLKKKGFKEFEVYQNEIFIGKFINQTSAAKALGLKKSTFVDIFKGKRIKNKGIKVVLCE